VLAQGEKWGEKPGSGPLGWDHPCIEEHVVTAADGTRLTTTLVIPYPCDGKYPAVMDRTPYGPTIDLLDLFYVPTGFTAILQNQRGCFTSGGDYNFWKQDGADAYDSMVWFTNHSTYNGEIFINGASADGCSALADWTQPNPYIKGANYVWATGYGHESAYWGGAYREVRPGKESARAHMSGPCRGLKERGQALSSRRRHAPNVRIPSPFLRTSSATGS
jgi:hypothetical protein